MEMMEDTRNSANVDGVIGEVLAGLASEPGRANPYPFYERLRPFGPYVTAADGSVIVSGYRAVSALLKDHRLGKAPERRLTAEGYPDWRERPSLRLMYTSLLMLNPPAHTRQRQLVSAAFTPRRVEGLRPAVERIVADLLDALDQRETTDFIAAFAFPLPVAVIGELLGIPASDWPTFQTLSRNWVAVLEDLTPTVVDRADLAAAAISDYLADLARIRASQPRDDMVSAMAQAADGDRLTGEEVVTMAALMLVAGFETTTGLLSNGLLALLDHPSQAARLRDEPGLAMSATEELLRYDAPIQLMLSRVATEDMEVAGMTLRAGQRVTSLLGAANRDPAVFTRPDELIVDRHEEPAVSFGGGIHYCLGAALARLEGQAAFPALLTRFPRIALAGRPVPRAGIGFHGHIALPVSTR
jgi:cytochrome P450